MTCGLPSSSNLLQYDARRLRYRFGNPDQQHARRLHPLRIQQMQKSQTGLQSVESHAGPCSQIVGPDSIILDFHPKIMQPCNTLAPPSAKSYICRKSQGKSTGHFFQMYFQQMIPPWRLAAHHHRHCTARKHKAASDEGQARTPADGAWGVSRDVTIITRFVLDALPSPIEDFNKSVMKASMHFGKMGRQVPVHARTYQTTRNLNDKRTRTRTRKRQG
jgi:hypothetical protein